MSGLSVDVYKVILIWVICRFGNFIGEAEESEEELQHEGTAANAYIYDEEPEEEAAANDQQLMELDGEHRC